MIKPGGRYLFVLTLIVVLVATWWVYFPGLNGGFLFDDFANLPALGNSGPVNTWPTFWRYITSGSADPTGRPLALLSFLIDAHNWPADPRPFLRTSVILHLVNGVLLAWLLRQLGRALCAFPAVTKQVGTNQATPVTAPPHPAADTDAACTMTTAAFAPEPACDSSLAWRINLAAVLGAALWLLHPLFVSTTLYIVQREAMLPATSILIGLLLWLHGRDRMLCGHSLRGLTWMVLGLGGCTLLGVLSKANGILLPALALVIEYTVLRAHAIDATTPAGKRHYRRAMLVLGWLPAAIVAAYLLHRGWSGIVHGISARRPWTLGQRLLTEPRVLIDYLDLLWLPRPFTPGLFNDQIHASASLLSPATTLPALLAILGLIIGAGLLRRRWPAAAMAVLFYFVGQSLESSTVALELYYEHRNYLPAMLMFWPLALWLCSVRWRDTTAAQGTMRATIHTHRTEIGEDATEGHPTGPATEPARVKSSHPATSDAWGKAKIALAIVLLAGLGTMTYSRASLWGNPHDQALLWATLNPDSPRAQASAAQAEVRAGHPSLAVARLKPALAKEPAQVQLALNLFAAECAQGHVDAATVRASKNAVRTSRNTGSLLTHWFGRAIRESAHPACPQASLDSIQQLLDAVQQNPRLMAIAGRRQDTDYLQGVIALTRGQPDAALADFNRALDQNVRATAALKQAAQLGSHGYPRRALAHLDHYEAEVARDQKRPKFGMPRIHAWVLSHQQYWPKEMVRLRATLRDDAQQQQANQPR